MHRPEAIGRDSCRHTPTIARRCKALDNAQGEVRARSGVALRLIFLKPGEVPEVQRRQVMPAGEAVTGARVEEVLTARNIEEAFSNRTVIAPDVPKCAISWRNG